MKAGSSSGEDARTVRVGIVGLGFMGKVHYETYGALEGAKVVALCVECEVQAARTGKPVRVRL